MRLGGAIAPVKAAHARQNQTCSVAVVFGIELFIVANVDYRNKCGSTKYFDYKSSWRKEVKGPRTMLPRGRRRFKSVRDKTSLNLIHLLFVFLNEPNMERCRVADICFAADFHARQC